MNKIFSSLLTVSAITLQGTAYAGSNLILNGSFEDGNWGGANSAWKRLYAGDTSLTGWTVGGKGVDWHNSVEFNPIQDGTRAVDLNLDWNDFSGSLSQSFSTIAGDNYVLSFSMAGPGFFGGQRTAQVNISDVEKIFAVNESSNSALVWGVYSLLFTATSTNTTVSFSGTGTGGYWGPVLDNVSVTAASVPEPDTYAMLISGIGLLGAMMMRRAKSHDRAVA